MSLLDKITCPNDVKKLSVDETKLLASEIRHRIIEVTSKNGGHLASNLGVVELSIALHRVFSTPEDKIVWDVGHQSYIHKILTGRNKNFDTLRTYGGVSGFTLRKESVYDPFGAGHSGTSVSAAEGIAIANKLNGNNHNAIAVVGDGALTGGMIYEALNDCASRKIKLIVILNDNEMSISKNVGGMSKHLSKISTSTKYFDLKRATEKAFMSIPVVGKSITKSAKAVKDFAKKVVTEGNVFESLGWHYIGVVDGNNIESVEAVLNEAKQADCCTLIHVRTKKGKGYAPAEKNPCVYHSVAPFDPKKGIIPFVDKDCFSYAFGSIMCELAEKDKDICAVTAAMCDGTGLAKFQRMFPVRFFDVGIAEEHAATLCASMASQGKKPVFAVYSTFSQRAYDQIVHDAALQELPYVLALDRAGFTASDGATHHGVQDISFLNGIPNVEIFSPETYSELKRCLEAAFDSKKLSVVRYPKDREHKYDRSGFINNEYIKYCDYGDNPKTAIITFGRITENAVEAAKMLVSNGISIRVIKLIKIKPVDINYLSELICDTNNLYFLEEGIMDGGTSEKTVSELALCGKLDGKKVVINAIKNKFVPFGTIKNLYEECGFLPEQIADQIKKSK